ncbi:hypothetical protein RC74_02225 [Falsihalocynthiibacter arcticus]|uniref:Uncharacterized protein n=1 Tax=Falsihalocynthiibacter arcticus TaxID=1579316 RepID=A0A126UW14_9RHOB|nr:hypothetical protein RC74_02225 [Falsihalocynthiibacter arcticus]
MVWSSGVDRLEGQFGVILNEFWWGRFIACDSCGFGTWAIRRKTQILWLLGIWTAIYMELICDEKFAILSG